MHGHYDRPKVDVIRCRKLKEEGYRLKNKIKFKGVVTEMRIK
jgi:hypothetical protein